MPQSARSTFKLSFSRCAGILIKFQCLSRHDQPSSLQSLSRVHIDYLVSMPQSARSTFKPAEISTLYFLVSCFNASVGTINLQARCKQRAATVGKSFNASVGTINLQAK